MDATVRYQKFIRLPEVLALKGTGRTAHFDEVKMGTYPPPIALGRRARGWPLSEVGAMMEARAAGLTDDELRTFVRTLVEARSFRSGVEGGTNGMLHE